VNSVVIGGDAGRKAAIGRFHIPVPVVDADNIQVIILFHFHILLFSFVLVSDLCVQLTIGRQHRPAEIVAVDTAPADDLHTAMRLSVIQ
jgi:hypothetical protein